MLLYKYQDASKLYNTENIKAQPDNDGEEKNGGASSTELRKNLSKSRKIKSSPLKIDADKSDTIENYDIEAFVRVATNKHYLGYYPFSFKDFIC